MPHEGAGFQPLQLARAIPWALVVRVKHVALAIELRAERVLVIITADTPAVAQRLEYIRATVSIAVAHPRHLAALRAINPALLVARPLRETQHLVQPARIPCPLRHGCIARHTFRDPD